MHNIHNCHRVFKKVTETQLHDKILTLNTLYPSPFDTVVLPIALALCQKKAAVFLL